MIPDPHLKELFGIWGERGEKSACTIEGNCMLPTIRNGNTLVLKHGNRDIRRGDVVVFGAPGSVRVHRVVQIQNRSGKRHFLLKGDQVPTFHAPLSEEQILARVLEVHGPEKHLNLDSTFWKCMNYLMALRSQIQGRCSEAESPCWKGLNALLVCIGKLFPDRFGAGPFFRKVMVSVYRGGSSVVHSRKGRSDANDCSESVTQG
jgi:hypothetical protein